MLTAKQKRMFRAEGNRLKTEIWIGKDGISEGTLRTLENSFNTKELVKIKLQESAPLNCKDSAERLCSRSGAELVQIIGNTLLLYRPRKEKE